MPQAAANPANTVLSRALPRLSRDINVPIKSHLSTKGKRLPVAAPDALAVLPQLCLHHQHLGLLTNIVGPQVIDHGSISLPLTDVAK